MTDYLRSSGVNVSGVKVRKALKRVNPEAQHHRATTASRSLNPKIYRADYFGNKLHMDQNEKLVMFGCIYVCARDGFSGAIVGFSVMPPKKNKIIYDEVLRLI